MSFGQAVSTVFSKYATFSGRARRSEYWWWYLFVTIVFVVAGVIDRAAGLTYGVGQGDVGAPTGHLCSNGDAGAESGVHSGCNLSAGMAWQPAAARRR